MACCPYLVYGEENGIYRYDYYCRLCKRAVCYPEVYNKCKTDYDDDYENCFIYRLKLK
ncbi:MAG: hypothetical protein IKD04_04575 [Clostridia bacterium]|nr:hypothetical protein [Clostridia bacterium]